MNVKILTHDHKIIIALEILINLYIEYFEAKRIVKKATELLTQYLNY